MMDEMVEMAIATFPSFRHVSLVNLSWLKSKIEKMKCYEIQSHHIIVTFIVIFRTSEIFVAVNLLLLKSVQKVNNSGIEPSIANI